MDTFGLIGKSLKHSFSKDYFTEKFESQGISANYKNFELKEINDLRHLIEENPEILGLNVTIPYKEVVIPLLDSLSYEAKAIGAVNTIKISNIGLIGYNTDAFGFGQSIKPFLKHGMEKALILGTGGASKAVAYALRQTGLDVFFASRNPQSPDQINYTDLNDFAIRSFKLIVNTTPLGTWPEVESAPNIPYDAIGEEHLLYDLVYNPKLTKFLQEGEERGALVVNGLSMLKLQAEKSWEIWNSKS